MDGKNQFLESQKQLCIATLDPENKGGILSMMSFIYEMAEKKGLNPFLVYNLVPSLRKNEQYRDITILEFIKRRKAKIYFEEKYRMRGFTIERILPELEFFNYILNLKKWKKAISKGNIFFAVGGSNYCALPFALLNKKFSLWIATPLYEDRIDRIKREPLLRKIRDYLSLPILLYFEKIIFKKTEKILVLSSYTKNKIIDKYKIKESTINIVPFPIEIQDFYPIEYSKRKNNYLLFTGRIDDERKNIPLLLSVFSKIRLKFPDLKLKLIGGKPNKKIRDLIEKLKIQNYIEITDNLSRKDLLPYYQNALLFIIPSFQEGLCISGLEALACGIPVISTRCGGPEDFIKDDYNGYLIENNNEKELYEAILRFLNFDNTKKKITAENCRNYILENHSPGKILPEFSNILNKNELPR
jgi:glycosyltransferase involved in cell wall biosynthesis